MKCSKCGKEIANDSQFCEYCGAKIDSTNDEGNNFHRNPNHERKCFNKKDNVKKTNIVWFVVALLSLVIIGASLLFWRERKELIISQKQVGILEDKVCVANCLIEQASSTIKNVTNDTVYSDWVSTNHNHGSISFQDYNFDVSEGDDLSFGYYVSSEKTHDRLIVTLSFIDNDSVIENNLITVSGEEISHFTYHFDRSGHYSVRVQYVKDHSIHKYKDMAGINNFVVLRNHKDKFDSIDSLINQWLHFDELPNAKEVATVSEAPHKSGRFEQKKGFDMVGNGKER